MPRCFVKHFSVSFTEYDTVQIIAVSCHVFQKKNMIIQSGATTLKLSATGRRAAPLDSLDVYNPKISFAVPF